MYFEKGVLVTTLVAFQKTQVFFALAIQVPALHALNADRLLQAPTFYQVSLNIWFIAMISAAGVYPVVLGLVVLRKSQGPPEYFLLVASIACVIVCFASWSLAMNKDLASSQLEQDGFSPVNSGAVNPLQHCANASSTKLLEKLTTELGEKLQFPQWWLSIGSFCLLACLTVEKSIATCFQVDLGGLPIVFRLFSELVIFSFEGWLIWQNVEIFRVFYKVWSMHLYEGRVWTIGQVIGIGIWVPVILEWLYLVLREFSTFSHQKLCNGLLTSNKEASSPT